MKIKFCGAAQQVTGSCHLLTLDNGYTILLDCGLFQGDADNLYELNGEFLFDPREIDVMILSHAHIDHCGRIPKLVKDGFKGYIYCTDATRDLAAIMLMDTAHIQVRDAEFHNERVLRKIKNRNDPRFAAKERKPLYEPNDVRAALKNFIGVSYDKWVDVVQGVRVLFTDAGHILGAASINLIINKGGDEFRLAFSGDIGRPNRPILRDPQEMFPADVVITESTYGDKLHIEKPAEKERFLSIIKETCIGKRGKLLIPAFSVGRTQEVLYILDQLVNEKSLPQIPVFIDSPLAINATEIFRSHPECFDDELHEYILKDPDPFGFRQANFISDVNESKKLNTSKEPSIIISASGMMNAGRVKHHLFNMIENPRNTLLLIGYCSPETPGGKLSNGDTEIKLFGELLPVNMHIEKMDSFSAHGDYQEMIDFLHNQKEVCEKMFLVHGELQTQSAYRDRLQNTGFKNIQIPNHGEEVGI